jgi:hypothetical protein
MNRLPAFVLLLALCGFARADTLLIVHQNGEETMTGTFVSLVILDDYGTLDFAVSEDDVASWDAIFADDFDTEFVPWDINLTREAGTESTTSYCQSFLRYFDGYPTLTLRCAD